jgi:hypothetical protein
MINALRDGRGNLIDFLHDDVIKETFDPDFIRDVLGNFATGFDEAWQTEFMTLLGVNFKEMTELSRNSAIATLDILYQGQLNFLKRLGAPEIQSRITTLNQHISNSIIKSNKTIKEKIAELEELAVKFGTRIGDLPVVTFLDADETEKELIRFKKILGFDDFWKDVKPPLLFDDDYVILEGKRIKESLKLHEGATSTITRYYKLSTESRRAFINTINTAISEQKRLELEQAQRANQESQLAEQRLSEFKQRISNEDIEFNRRLRETENLEIKEKYKEQAKIYNEHLVVMDKMLVDFKREVKDVFTLELSPKIKVANIKKVEDQLINIPIALRKKAADSFKKELGDLKIKADFFGLTAEEQIEGIDKLKGEFELFVEAVRGMKPADITDLFADPEEFNRILKEFNDWLNRRNALIVAKDEELRTKREIEFRQGEGFINEQDVKDAEYQVQQLSKMLEELPTGEVDFALDKESIANLLKLDEAVKSGIEGIQHSANLVEELLENQFILRDIEISKIEDVDERQRLRYANEKTNLLELLEVQKQSIDEALKEISPERLKGLSIPVQEIKIALNEEAIAKYNQRIIDIKKQLADLGIDIADFEVNTEKKKWAEVIDIARTAQQGLINIIGTRAQLSMQQAQRDADAWAEAEQEKIDATLDATKERLSIEQKQMLAFARTRQQQAKIEEEFKMQEEEAEAEAELRKEEIEKQKEEKILAAKKKEFERNKAIAISNAIISIAEAVTKIFAQTGVAGAFIAPAIAAALTAVQLGAIMAQKFPGYSKGGLVEDEDTPGKGKLIKVNEQGEEFVVNARATKKYSKLLEAINAGKEIGSFIKGGFTGVGDMLMHMLQSTSLPQNNLALASAGMVNNQVMQANPEIIAELKELNRNTKNNDLLTEVKKLNSSISNGFNDGIDC